MKNNKNNNTYVKYNAEGQYYENCMQLCQMAAKFHTLALRYAMNRFSQLR